MKNLIAVLCLLAVVGCDVLPPTIPGRLNVLALHWTGALKQYCLGSRVAEIEIRRVMAQIPGESFDPNNCAQIRATNRLQRHAPPQGAGRALIELDGAVFREWPVGAGSCLAGQPWDARDDYFMETIGC